MRRKHSTAFAFASILSVAAFGSTLSAREEKGKPSPAPAAGMGGHAAHDTAQTTDPPEPLSEPTLAPRPAPAAGMSLSAVLVDPQAKARKNAATVQVHTRGVRLVDPAVSGERPIPGRGHLHYQVDDGPIVATPAPKLSFHGLKSGTHTISVTLAANDHTPLGPAQKLSVTIP